jgi:proliferating cell nuclear antigen
MSEKAIASFEYPSAKVFIALLEAVGEVADEVLMRLTAEGLKIKALDPARISLMELEIPSSAFTSYSLESSELNVGVNLSSLLKMLPKPKKSEVVKFSANEMFYYMTIEGAVPKSFKFRSIEVAAEEIPELSLEFTVKAVLLTKGLKQAFSTLKGSGTIEVEVPDADHMVLKGGGASVKLSRVSGSIIDMEFKESARSTYEESYLVKVGPLLGLTDSLEFSFKSSSPLSMIFRIPGDAVVRYVLAPQA